MRNLISDLFKSVYVAVCCGGAILLLVAWVRISRRSSVSRTWEPLVPIVKGTLKRIYGSAELRGTYGERAIFATRILGGAEDPDRFRIEMSTISHGADWLIRYGSERLFGKDQWYLEAGHETLRQRLEQSDILATMQRWESHPTISYQTNSGVLTYEEEGQVPSPEHFRAQLELLFHLAQINEQVNGIF